MAKLKSRAEMRMRALELATEIAAEAAQNPNVVWMIEFQEELLERLFRKMITLLEEEGPKGRALAPDDDRDDESDGKDE